MENNDAGSGGTNVAAGGQDGQPENPTDNQPSAGADPGGNKPSSDDKVSYDSYSKLLKEKKALAERLGSLEKAVEAGNLEKQEAEDQRLKEQSKFKEYAESLEKQLERERLEKKEQSERLEKGAKLDAFLDSVTDTHGRIPKAYWALIDLDKVIMDPNTNLPELGSVKEAVNDFVKEYPEVIKGRAGGPSVPPNAPTKTATMLTYKEWLTLPPKEMKRRAKEVQGPNE